MTDTPPAFPEAADAAVAVMAANAVSELFTMPGDAFPVLEAAARASRDGRPSPRIVTCLHEIIAVAAAHGHHMVSGIPQACLLHVDVGLQMAGGMLHNAQRGRAGMLILGGKTPVSWDGAHRGGRVIDMHWMQDRGDLGGTVRDYVKWSYDVQRPGPLAHALQRGIQIAGAQPSGPVYISLLREMLMETFDGEIPDPARHAAPVPAVPDSNALEQVADLLCAAKAPMIVAGHLGRDPAGFDALGDLATIAAAPVYSRAARANISSENPMYLGTQHGQALAEADLVLLLDVDVPWTPLFHRLRDDAKVVRIDVDPLKADMGLWSFPADVSLEGNTVVAARLLADLVEDRRTAAQTHAAEKRRSEVAAAHAARSASLGETARSSSGNAPVSVAYLASCIADLVDEQTIVVDDSTTALATTAEYIPTRVPGSYFQPMGSSMGWGAGAALGAKLAAPEKTVISINAEGNFLSGAPEAALWGAAGMNAPFLTVVFNNSQYAAIKLGVLHEYPDSALAAAGTALELNRLPDLSTIAKSVGAHAERVERADDVDRALARGVEAVRGGQSAVVDVSVEKL